MNVDKKMTEDYMKQEMVRLSDALVHAGSATPDAVALVQSSMYCAIQLARIAESLAMLANNSEQLKEKPIVNKTEE